MLNSNPQLVPETDVSAQNGDPGVSSSDANAIMPEMPGQLFNLHAYFSFFFLFLYGLAVFFMLVACAYLR